MTTAAKALEDIAAQCDAGGRLVAAGPGPKTMAAAWEAVAALARKAAAEVLEISDDDIRWALCCGEVGYCNANNEAPCHEMSPDRYAEKYGCESAEYDRQLAAIKKLIASKIVAAPTECPCCFDAGHVAYALGVGNPHFKVCEACGNPKGLPSP